MTSSDAGGLEVATGSCPDGLELWKAQDGAVSTQGEEPTGWDFLGTVPVPVRQVVFKGLSHALSEHVRHGGRPLRACFPMGQGGPTPFDLLTQARRHEDLPAMLVSADDELLFDPRLQSVFADRYTAVQPDDPPDPLTRAGLFDPLGKVGVFAVAPFVLLVDRRRLGALPTPRCWADLLEPAYAGQIVLGGWKRPHTQCPSQYNGYLMLALCERFGIRGLSAFAKNVRGFLHSVEMPRLAGSASSVGGIYVLPWSLADLCPRRDVTSVVWPEDGALAYPLWSVVSADRSHQLRALLDYFRGPALGTLLNRNRYPFLGCGDLSSLPKHAQFWWPGWQTVRSPHAAARRHRATGTFFTVWNPKTFHLGEAPARCA